MNHTYLRKTLLIAFLLLGGVARIHAMDNTDITCMPPLCENATTDEIVAHFNTLIKTWEQEAAKEEEKAEAALQDAKIKIIFLGEPLRFYQNTLEARQYKDTLPYASTCTEIAKNLINLLATNEVIIAPDLSKSEISAIASSYDGLRTYARRADISSLENIYLKIKDSVAMLDFADKLLRIEYQIEATTQRDYYGNNQTPFTCLWSLYRYKITMEELFQAHGGKLALNNEEHNKKLLALLVKYQKNFSIFRDSDLETLSYPEPNLRWR